jgi:hypothetical protein
MQLSSESRESWVGRSYLVVFVRKSEHRAFPLCAGRGLGLGLLLFRRKRRVCDRRRCMRPARENHVRRLGQQPTPLAFCRLAVKVRHEDVVVGHVRRLVRRQRRRCDVVVVGEHTSRHAAAPLRSVNAHVPAGHLTAHDRGCDAGCLAQAAGSNRRGRDGCRCLRARHPEPCKCAQDMAIQGVGWAGQHHTTKAASSAWRLIFSDPYLALGRFGGKGL